MKRYNITFASAIIMLAGMPSIDGRSLRLRGLAERLLAQDSLRHFGHGEIGVDLVGQIGTNRLIRPARRVSLMKQDGVSMISVPVLFLSADGDKKGFNRHRQVVEVTLERVRA